METFFVWLMSFGMGTLMGAWLFASMSLIMRRKSSISAWVAVLCAVAMAACSWFIAQTMFECPP